MVFLFKREIRVPNRSIARFLYRILANSQLEIRFDMATLASSHPNLANQFRVFEIRSIRHGKLFNVQRMTLLQCALIYLLLEIVRRKSLLNARHWASDSTSSCSISDPLTDSRRFLQRPTKSELFSSAKAQGRINRCIQSDIRSNAFLITADNICFLRLPLLTSNSL